MPANLTLPSRPGKPGIILFGLECRTTSIVLRELSSAGANIRLLCMPGGRSIPVLKTGGRRALPMSPERDRVETAADIANSIGINIWRLGDLRLNQVQDALDEVDADMIVVACYNQLLPAALYSKRRIGGINLHPSLLPAKRGPDPLFWIFRDGDDVVGSTVHSLSDSFDAGPILAQQSTVKRDGISEDDLDAMLARLGSSLVLDVLTRIESAGMGGREQSEDDQTWAPHPTPDDFVLDRAWSARHAFNFVRGLHQRGQPILVELDEGMHRVLSALDWQDRDDTPMEPPPGARSIEFGDGRLVASLTALPE